MEEQGILTKEQEKLVANWIDDAIKLKGIWEVVDGYAARALVSLVDNSGAEKLKEEVKEPLRELVTLAFAGEIEKAEALAATILNTFIDIPLIDEAAEQLLFEGAVKVIVGAVLSYLEKRKAEKAEE